MIPPDDDRTPEIEAFWSLARFHAKLNTMPGYFGPTPLESVPPPDWSFGDDAGLAELLAERGTVLTGGREDYGDELPQVGALGIVCDTAGRPRALVATTGVDVTEETVSERLAVVWTLDDH